MKRLLAAVCWLVGHKAQGTPIIGRGKVIVSIRIDCMRCGEVLQ